MSFKGKTYTIEELRPEAFDGTVRGVILAASAGFLVPLLGEILRMPGLPSAPQAEICTIRL